MNRYKRNNGALIGVLGVLVALTMTAAIGVMAASQYTGPRAPAMNPQRSDVCVSCRGAISGPSPLVPIEPELMRTDRANEHHG